MPPPLAPIFGGIAEGVGLLGTLWGGLTGLVDHTQECSQTCDGFLGALGDGAQQVKNTKNNANNAANSLNGLIQGGNKGKPWPPGCAAALQSLLDELNAMIGLLTGIQNQIASLYNQILGFSQGAGCLGVGAFGDVNGSLQGFLDQINNLNAQYSAIQDEIAQILAEIQTVLAECQAGTPTQRRAICPPGWQLEAFAGRDGHVYRVCTGPAVHNGPHH